jgi:hypothetical protein
LNQAGPDRIDEVGPIHALEGVADGVKIEQVTNDDLCPELAKVFGPLVPAMDERADLPAPFEKLSRSRAAGRSCGTGDEETQIGHLPDSQGSDPI